MGATTMWERWDGYTEERGFQTPDMNSFNHYAFGCVGEWLFEAVAGIEPQKPGFRRVIIRPRLEGDMRFVRASYNSIRGRIGVEWNVEGDKLYLSIVIPANITAEVYVPTEDPATVTESGKPVDQADGVKLLRSEENLAVYEVESGSYRFTAMLR